MNQFALEVLERHRLLLTIKFIITLGTLFLVAPYVLDAEKIHRSKKMKCNHCYTMMMKYPQICLKFVMNKVYEVCDLHKMNTLDNILKASQLRPLQYRCTSKNTFSTYSATVKNYGLRKYEEYMSHQSKIFIEGFAPNDSIGFETFINEQKNEKSDDFTLNQIKMLYNESLTAQAKLAVLTIAVSQHFPHQALIQNLGCTLHNLRKAKNFVEMYGICESEEKRKHSKKKMKPDQFSSDRR